MLLSDVCLSDVCLSVAYIWPKSRTKRPRTTNIGTEVAHVKIAIWIEVRIVSAASCEFVY